MLYKNLIIIILLLTYMDTSTVTTDNGEHIIFYA